MDALDMGDFMMWGFAIGAAGFFLLGTMTREIPSFVGILLSGAAGGFIAAMIYIFASGSGVMN